MWKSCCRYAVFGRLTTIKTVALIVYVGVMFQVILHHEGQSHMKYVSSVSSDHTCFSPGSIMINSLFLQPQFHSSNTKHPTVPNMCFHCFYPYRTMISGLPGGSPSSTPRFSTGVQGHRCSRSFLRGDVQAEFRSQRTFVWSWMG